MAERGEGALSEAQSGPWGGGVAVGRQAGMSGGGLGFNPNRPSTSPH